MDGLDLNIHNYDLNDLLHLFKVPFQFDESHLKEAKKIVMKTHPDKSKLDKKFFLFFSQAYKYLLKIYQLRQSSTTVNIEYDKKDMWSQEHSILIDGQLKNMDQKQFNSWFNDKFEQTKLKDEDESTGYGNWLKSDDDIIDDGKTKSQMEEYIQEKKRNLRALTIHEEFQDINNNNSHFDLIRDAPQDYSSSMFGTLQYDDLKKAHTESLIPVTDEDYKNRKQYQNIDELNRERTHDIIQNKDKWFSSQEEQLKDTQSNETDVNIKRAYKLMNQDEQIRNNYKNFWNDLKRINN